MIVFDVFRNGERLCRAGVGEHGVLSAIVTWVSPGTYADGSSRNGGTRLDVSGLATGPHLTWVSERLALGDEIRIVIAEADDADEVAGQQRVDDPQSRTKCGTDGR